MAHDVFISYATEDKTIADAVVHFVERTGLRCWIAPRDAVAGAQYGSSIIDAINASGLVVLILSSHSNRSDWVTAEVERAASKRKVILPVRVEDVQPSGAIELYIAGRHWLDAIDPPMERHLEELCARIRALVGATGELDSGGGVRPVVAHSVGPRVEQPVAAKRRKLLVPALVVAALGGGVWWISTFQSRPEASGAESALQGEGLNAEGANAKRAGIAPVSDASDPRINLDIDARLAALKIRIDAVSPPGPLAGGAAPNRGRESATRDTDWSLAQSEALATRLEALRASRFALASLAWNSSNEQRVTDEAASLVAACDDLERDLEQALIAARATLLSDVDETARFAASLESHGATAEQARQLAERAQALRGDVQQAGEWQAFERARANLAQLNGAIREYASVLDEAARKRREERPPVAAPRPSKALADLVDSWRDRRLPMVVRATGKDGRRRVSRVDLEFGAQDGNTVEVSAHWTGEDMAPVSFALVGEALRAPSLRAIFNEREQLSADALEFTRLPGKPAGFVDLDDQCAFYGATATGVEAYIVVPPEGVIWVSTLMTATPGSGWSRIEDDDSLQVGGALIADPASANPVTIGLASIPRGQPYRLRGALCVPEGEQLSASGWTLTSIVRRSLEDVKRDKRVEISLVDKGQVCTFDVAIPAGAVQVSLNVDVFGRGGTMRWSGLRLEPDTRPAAAVEPSAPKLEATPSPLPPKAISPWIAKLASWNGRRLIAIYEYKEARGNARHSCFDWVVTVNSDGATASIAGAGNSKAACRVDAEGVVVDGAGLASSLVFRPATSKRALALGTLPLDATEVMAASGAMDRHPVGEWSLVIPPNEITLLNNADVSGTRAPGPNYTIEGGLVGAAMLYGRPNVLVSRLAESGSLQLHGSLCVVDQMVKPVLSGASLVINVDDHVLTSIPINDRRVDFNVVVKQGAQRISLDLEGRLLTAVWNCVWLAPESFDPGGQGASKPTKR